MNGWGTTFLTIAPDGAALPCHSARELPGLEFPNVRDFSVRDIWENSEAFNKFRGFGWMKEPCRSCPEKTKDFGGCRCQAFLLTGDMTATDPVCNLSPNHAKIEEAIESSITAQQRAIEKPLVFRNPKNSEAFSST